MRITAKGQVTIPQEIRDNVFSIGKADPLMLGTAFAVNEVAKFALNKLIQRLGKKFELKSSRIQYIETASNFLIDATYVITVTALGYMSPFGTVVVGALAIGRLYFNIKAARAQSLVDYPFTSNNFQDPTS